METKETQDSGGGFGAPRVEDKAVRGPKEPKRQEPRESIDAHSVDTPDNDSVESTKE
jgi:hypothetical protein